ncbi:hypothetical protein J6590_008308 [Homalodisca vitripennis]|nr:hypothetical protein J6590_008308 [Homalodisca vitripennis]
MRERGTVAGKEGKQRRRGTGLQTEVPPPLLMTSRLLRIVGPRTTWNLLACTKRRDIDLAAGETKIAAGRAVDVPTIGGRGRVWER